jgi:hypothetical protein
LSKERHPACRALGVFCVYDPSTTFGQRGRAMSPALTPFVRMLGTAALMAGLAGVPMRVIFG